MRLKAVEYSVPLLAVAPRGTRYGEYWRVQNPLPEDSELVYTFMGAQDRSVVFVFTHESFEDVPLGAVIPREELVYESRLMEPDGT